LSNAQRGAIAALIALAGLAGMPVTRAETLSPLEKSPPSNSNSKNLIPLPGWITDHSAQWTKDRAAYQKQCQTEEVKAEIDYLKNIDSHDHQLMIMTRTYANDSATKGDLLELTGKLRDDIATLDILAEQLRALPECPAAEVNPTAPASAVTTSDNAATPDNEASSTGAHPESARRIVVRFDDRLPALTPQSIRALDEAIAAMRKGERVQFAIEGCAAGAAKQTDSVCARRVSSLMGLLFARGVPNPKGLLADDP
jgi:hypothetical protein